MLYQTKSYSRGGVLKILEEVISMVILDKYYDEMVVGQRWISQGRTVTETDIVAFAALTGDWYPLHTDITYASTTRFGKRIAHGLLVLGIASGLLRIDPGTLVAFYGMDRVRFLQPTFIGDTLHVEMVVTALKDRGHEDGLVTFEQRITNQNQETVAISILKIVLAKSRLDDI